MNPTDRGRPRVLLIVNPHAASVTAERRELVVSALARRVQLDLVLTERPGHGTELARAAAAGEDHDVLVTLGGDGTINEAVNGLGTGSQLPLFSLPGGSANVLAKMLGIPGELVEATAMLLAALRERETRPVDLASVNGRLFTFTSGVGFDAAVVERVDANPAAKRRFRAWYFAATAAHTFARGYALGRVPRLTIAGDHAGGVSGLTAIIQNGRPYTYFGRRPIELSRHAGLETGTLAGAVLADVSPLAMPSIARRALTFGRAIAEDPRIVELEPAPTVTVAGEQDAELPLHVDGDFVGRVRRAEYRVHPASLQVLRPGVTE